MANRPTDRPARLALMSAPKWTFDVAATLAAPADEVWLLLACPARWPEWGPSIRRVQCADPVVRAGTTGRVRTALGPTLPFVVTAAVPGRSWHWRVGGVPATGHRVEPIDEGRTRVVFEVPVWGAPYAVVCRRALRRLAACVATDRQPRGISRSS